MATDLFDLSGRVALVTGAAQGLGFAIAKAFAAHGAEVVLADLNADGAENAASQLHAFGGKVHAVTGDVGRHETADALAGEALRRCGRIDVLVCNAGIQGPAAPLLEVSDADWEHVMHVNLMGAFWLCSRLIPGMVEGGSVILMSSIAGLRGNKRIGLYGLSKAAVAQLARNLALEWGPKKVRVNAISPGVIRTPLAHAMIDDSAYLERRLSLTPLRRLGEPHEIAGVALMLASRAGGFITGQNLVVDGGTTIGDGN